MERRHRKTCSHLPGVTDSRLQQGIKSTTLTNKKKKREKKKDSVKLKK